MNGEDQPIVEPKPGVSPDAETTPTAETPAPEASAALEKGSQLDDEVLKIPAMQAVFAGSPPAVSATLAEFNKRPEAKLIIANKDALVAAGMGLYKSLSGELGVIFNQFHIHPEELVQADKKGILTKIAPPFDTVNDHIAKSGANHPILSMQGIPGGPKGAPMPTPPQASDGITQPPASVQNKVATARTNSLTNDQPTQGPRPGAGRLLNSILKNVV
jgi:hypothetical protein